VNKGTFWINFKLNEELHVAGAFIYNGLRSIHEIDKFTNDDEVFESIYPLAVGLERLLKIGVVLIEYDDSQDHLDFEKSLITHDHLSLVRRIKKRRKLDLTTQQNELLQLLSRFYKTHRYERISMNWSAGGSGEVEALHSFLRKHLKIKISDSGFYVAMPHHEKITKFIARTIGKLTQQLYELVRAEARQRTIFTYDLRSESKAARVFLNSEFGFLPEDILILELLVFLMKTTDRKRPLSLLDELEPLQWDPALMADYLRCFISHASRLEAIDQLECFYDELDDRRNRIELLKATVDPNVIFDDDEDEADEP